jgi:hypothetical protein
MKTPLKYQAGAPMPENMGAVADLYMEVRTIRLAAEKEIEPWKARENELREHMIQNIAKSRDEGGDTGAAGRVYRVQIKDKEVPKVTDWRAFHAYVAETGRFDLLQKRVSDKPVMELLDEGAVPGVEGMFVPDVSVTKIKS